MIAGIPGAKQRHANSAEVEHLHLNKAIKLRAPNTALISLPLLGYAVGRVSGKTSLVPSILELTSAPSHNPAAPRRQEGTISPAVQPIATAVHPVVLPVCPVNVNVFPRHYSLPQKQQSQPLLHKEIREFKSWMSTPIMLSRPGKSSASRTVDNVLKNCFLYLGFLFHHLRLEVFNLSLFLDTKMFSAYIAFLLAKGNQRACLTQLLSNARKVCHFLRRETASGGPATALVASVNGVETWLLRLSKQIITVLHKPKTDIAVLEKNNQWMAADELVVLLDKLRVDALAQLPADRKEVLSAYVARQIHEAALSSCLFGHLPPMRLSCIRSLQCPWFQRCVHRDCVGTLGNKDCQGNKLEVRGIDLYVILSHHKNRAKWEGSVIQFKVPQELRDLLHVFLWRCHPVLSPGVPFVFSDHKGRPFLEAAQLSVHWEQLLRNCGAKAVFPPNM